VTRDPRDFAAPRSDARASPRPRKWRGALCRGERATQTRGVLKGNKNPVEKKNHPNPPQPGSEGQPGRKRRHMCCEAKLPQKSHCWGVLGLLGLLWLRGSLLVLGLAERAGGLMESGLPCGFCISKYKEKIGLFCFWGVLDECGGRDTARSLYAVSLHPKGKKQS